MESASYGVYKLVVLYQKSHSFASLTCSISDTPQLVCKHRTRALSMKHSIFLLSRCLQVRGSTERKKKFKIIMGSMRNTFSKVSKRIVKK